MVGTPKMILNLQFPTYLVYFVNLLLIYYIHSSLRYTHSILPLRLTFEIPNPFLTLSKVSTLLTGSYCYCPSH